MPEVVFFNAMERRGMRDYFGTNSNPSPKVDRYGIVNCTGTDPRTFRLWD